MQNRFNTFRASAGHPLLGHSALETELPGAIAAHFDEALPGVGVIALKGMETMKFIPIKGEYPADLTRAKRY